MPASRQASRLDDVIPGGTWHVEPSGSTVAFKLRHLMLVPVRGRFTEFEGTLAVGGDGRASARGSVATASLDTGDVVRDERLRGPEFFDSAASPQMRFVATSVEALDGRRLAIAGELTIGRTTRAIELRAKRRGDGDRLELDLSGELSRREFGIESQQLLDAGISDRVELELAVVLQRDA